MMCDGCVEDGHISRYLYDIINAFLERWPDAQHGNGHIVLSDSNVEDGHIAFCLCQVDQPWQEGLDVGPWRGLLHWMLTIPENERCPMLRGAGVSVR